MDHMRLTDELRQQLLEAAAWGKADIKVTLNEEVTEEAEERLDERKRSTKKGQLRKTARRAYEEPVEEEGENDEDGEYLEEEAVHVCPLCVSQLDESIDEERILEHLDVVMGLVDRLSQLNEGDEDIDTVIDETLAELLLQDEE
jgi:Pyruvate/2-oxoacid:ferredoxin oxidoreductase gamma subunit